MQQVLYYIPLGRIFWITLVLSGFFCFATLTAFKPVIGFAIAIPIIYGLLYYRFSTLFIWAFVFSLGFGAFLNLPVTSGGFPIAIGIVFSGFILWTLSAMLKKDPDLVIVFNRRPEQIFVSGFLLLMFISLMNSAKFSASVKQIQLFIYCWLIFFFLQMVLKKREHIEKAIIWIEVAGVIVGIIGIIEIAIQKPLYWVLNNRSLFMADVSESALNAHAGRINGLIGDAPFHGIYMTIIASLSIYKFMTTSSRWAKLAFSGIFLLAVANVVLSASRGALIALILAFLVIWIFLEIRGKWVIMTGLVFSFIIFIFTLVIIMPEMNIERLFSSEGRSSDTAEMRLNNIPVAIKMFLDHPIIGTGPDGFVVNFQRYASGSAANRSHSDIMKTHNTPLQVLAEYGLVGSVFLGMLYFLTLKRLWTIVRSASGYRIKYLALSFMGILAGFLFFLSTSNSLLDKNLWMVISLSQCVITQFQNLEGGKYPV